MKQHLTVLKPDPQDWQILEQIAEIDCKSFGTDGISVFNLSQFARSGSLYCLTASRLVVAEAVLLANLFDSGAVLFAFAVLPESRNAGYGTLLLNQIIDTVKKDGITYIELTMNPSSEEATAFYSKKNGFTKISDLPLHPQKHEPRCLMRKEL